MEMMPAPSAPGFLARFVGPPDAGLKRSQILLYRLDFDLDDVPGETAMRLHLFADSRYRLWINGSFVMAGPARFVTQFPEYDSIDPSPFLQRGANCLAVEVHGYGCSSFQTMPDGRLGFIAWGEEDGPDFRTPGAWVCREIDAWDETASLYSFAQAACEICDTRKLDPAWYLPGTIDQEGWEPARLLEASETPWGELNPRSVPLPALKRTEPERIVVAGALLDRETIFGFHFPEKYMGPQQMLPLKLRQVYQTHIHSPLEQTVVLGVHWGDNWVNGEGVRPNRDGRGLRWEAAIELKAGWNTLVGHAEFLIPSEFWDILFGLPSDAGLVVAARPERDCEERFRVSPLIPSDEVTGWIKDGRPVDRDDWRVVGGGAFEVTPARLMGWLALDEVTLERGKPYGELKGEVADSGQLWTFEFAAEFVGHVWIDVEGAPGQVLDIGYDEWQQPDGRIDLYRTNPFVHTVERSLLKGGRQQIIGLNPRGGRFVQVVIHPMGGAKARLHGIALQETRMLTVGEGHFATNDPLDAAIWQASVATLVASTEEAYSDSPWRERGTYIGDFTVNQQVQRLLTPDGRIPRRGLRVFAQAQLENGQVPAVAPAHHRRPHEDFTLIWLIGIGEFWALTSDLEVVRELWPAMERVWSSSAWRADTDGLWAGEGLNVFIDWGVHPAERGGKANGVLNAFRIAALEHCADLARYLGLKARAGELREEATRIRDAFSKALWLPKQGRYAAHKEADGTLAESTAAHANLLAWAFQIGSTQQLDGVESYLFRLLEGNFALGNEKGQFSGQIELYFFRFLLTALSERGHGERALTLVRQHWGPLLADGFGTLPECFSRVREGTGSRCHSWSGHTASWYTQYVLGLRQEVPGNPDRWILQPLSLKGIDRAEGVLPHARGLIRVQWTRGIDGELIVKSQVPEGVLLTVRQE